MLPLSSGKFVQLLQLLQHVLFFEVLKMFHDVQFHRPSGLLCQRLGPTALVVPATGNHFGLGTGRYSPRAGESVSVTSARYARACSR